jgi:Carboxypeptidase regulatory-like domain
MKSAGVIIIFTAGIFLFSAFVPAQGAGTAGLSGVVHPPGATVRLLSESGRRATATTTPDGRYEFGTLSDGKYILQASAPGYATDALEVRIFGGRSAEQNVRLLYISRIDGIDWSKGIIHATGRGMYPSDSPNRPAAREMAKRAALSDAERNLLWIVEQIKVGPNQDLVSLPSRSYIARIKGYLQGFRVVGERDTGSGVEVELELPLTGPGGLTRFISD